MQALLDHYRSAKDWICSSPYLEEVRWQDAQSLTQINESQFLRQYAWVVLNSGFREAIVRKHFDFISLCFCDWESARDIATSERACVEAALSAFRNRRKLEAIASTAKLIAKDGFERFSCVLRENPAETLQKLPFIGAVTSFHLAKNLGAEVAKPDRHLVRVAARFGYSDVSAMCRDISLAVGDRISVTDLVLWRFEERTFAFGQLPR
jgi:hypothetical protein